MSERGVGDRWLRGEPIEGVAFRHLAHVRIAAGPYAGQVGVVALLMATRPEPLYLVEIGPRHVRVWQSALAPAA